MTRMHPDEVPIDSALVRRLVHGQFPDWAGLPLERVESGGTVNAIYRLGSEFSVRLPLVEWGANESARESRWLPYFADRLPLEIPEFVGLGTPDHGYPFPWSIHRWIDGEMVVPGSIPDLAEAARTMAEFLRALHATDARDGPSNEHRGRPLRFADHATRKALSELDGVIDTTAVRAEWERCLAASDWIADPVWIHGDLWHSNLLGRDDRIVAVIDWGNVGVGDPAIDTLLAWSLFDASSRRVFRDMLGVDDATWMRGRGWAISMAVLALPYYADTNPVIVANAHRMLEEVLSGDT